MATLKKIRKNPKDKRGKHTKASRIERKNKNNLHKRGPITCRECDAPESAFVPTSDNDRMVCTKCGWVSNDVIYKESRNFLDNYTFLSIQRSCYQRRNYFAERMRQFCNTEPRFTVEEENYIRAVYKLFLDVFPEEYGPENLSRSKIKCIFRTLNEYLPHLYFNTKSERWLQAISLFNPNISCGDPEIASKMKLMYEMVALVFESYYKPKLKLKNIPKINIFCLIFLYNVSCIHLIDHGWYFLSEDFFYQSKTMLSNFEKCCEILQMCNDLVENKAFISKYHDSVSLESHLFFFQDKFKFQIPEYEDLIYISLKSEQGKQVLNEYILKTIL